MSVVLEKAMWSKAYLLQIEGFRLWLFSSNIGATNKNNDFLFLSVKESNQNTGLYEVPGDYGSSFF